MELLDNAVFHRQLVPCQWYIFTAKYCLVPLWGLVCIAAHCRCVRVNLCMNHLMRNLETVSWKPDISMPLRSLLNRALGVNYFLFPLSTNTSSGFVQVHNQKLSTSEELSRQPVTAETRVWSHIVPLGSVVNKVSLGQVYLRALRFALINILVPILNTHSYTADTVLFLQFSASLNNTGQRLFRAKQKLKNINF